MFTNKRDNDTLGQRIARAREAAGLTGAQLARRLGVKTATIAAWESTRSEPRANRLTMLAGFLGVSPTWLLHGLGDSPEEDGMKSELALLRASLLNVTDLHRRTGEAIARLEDQIAALAD